MSTGSHIRSRQVAGSRSIPNVAVHGLVSFGSGRYAGWIRTPPHSAASTRRQFANVRTPLSTYGVVTSPIPIGMRAMDTRDRVKHNTAAGNETRATPSPRSAASATPRPFAAP